MAPEGTKTFSRRDIIKAGGVIALGLTYSRPFIETVQARPAFAGYNSTGFSGLTPGFWKQQHHYQFWTNYTPKDDYGQIFGVTPSFNKDLGSALKQGGGGEKALGRHAVAGLLNAANPNVNYRYSESEIVALVQGAYQSGDFETVKDLLVVQNELEGINLK